MKFYICFLLISIIACGWSQAPQPPTAPPISAAQQADIERILQERESIQRRAIESAERDGIRVRLGDLGQFRGARSNVVTGIGLIVGLGGTGDTKATPWTANLVANSLSRWGTFVNEGQAKAKNIATVIVTAEMPAFIAPGSKIDVTVSSNGDAKSLEGGVLLPTFLAGLSNVETTMAVAYGAVSIGGFNAASGGSAVRKNHATVGLISGGATIEKSVPTEFVFESRIMYFDLDVPDFTTAERSADALQDAVPGLRVEVVDGATIKLSIPDGVTPTGLAKDVEACFVMADTPATVVVNERTGTIVVGGNVRLGPALVAHGSLQISISTDYLVSQPAPLSNGETVVVAIPQVTAEETRAETQIVGPTASLQDLAKVFQTLKVSARDIIAILTALQRQGALKARIVLQ